MRQGSWKIIAILAAGAATLLLVLNWAFPGATDDEDFWPQMAYGLMLVTLFGAAAFGPRINLSEAVRNGLIWVGIFVAVFAVVSFREDFAYVGQRMMGELLPSQAQTTAAGTVSLRRSSNGHFMVNADVRGDGREAPVLFMVDTGASAVALSPQDARRIGFDPDSLRYTVMVNTANGRTSAAPVEIDRIAIGPAVVTRVRGLVIREGLAGSLLGLSYLDDLSGYSVQGDELVLTP